MTRFASLRAERSGAWQSNLNCQSYFESSWITSLRSVSFGCFATLAMTYPKQINENY